MLSQLSSYLHFKWLRYITKDMTFDLDISTMLEEDRQIKEFLQKHVNYHRGSVVQT